MSDKSSTSSVRLGPGGATLLTILFVLLKVYGKIDWSWWWVFSPLWISAILVTGVILFVAGLALAAAIWGDNYSETKWRHKLK